MKKQNVKQIIQDLARENFNSNSEQYPITEGIATDEASEAVADLAKSYYNNRTEQEEARDEELNVAVIDYVEWCMEEFAEFIES